MPFFDCPDVISGQRRMLFPSLDPCKIRFRVQYFLAYLREKNNPKTEPRNRVRKKESTVPWGWDHRSKNLSNDCTVSSVSVIKAAGGSLLLSSWCSVSGSSSFSSRDHSCRSSSSTSGGNCSSFFGFFSGGSSPSIFS